MNLPRVIALSGYRGSGKDTTAAHLFNKYGHQPISFAYVLKNMVAEQYGIDRSWLDIPGKKELPLTQYPVISTDPFTELLHHQLRDELKSGFWTPRALCILEGSVKRSVNSSYWVRTVVEHILNNQQMKFVITDLRYRSETDILRVMIPGIEMWRIDRQIEKTTLDPSERDLDEHKFDMYLSNSGSVADLHRTLEYIIAVRNQVG